MMMLMIPAPAPAPVTTPPPTPAPAPGPAWEPGAVAGEVAASLPATGKGPSEVVVCGCALGDDMVFSYH